MLETWVTSVRISNIGTQEIHVVIVRDDGPERNFPLEASIEHCGSCPSHANIFVVAVANGPW